MDEARGRRLCLVHRADSDWLPEHAVAQHVRRSSGIAFGRRVSSADKEFAELIFRAYEQKTGVKVLPLYDTEETKTAGLTSRLVAEKDHPKADVFWSSDTSRAVALVDQGVAESYVPKESAAISARYRSPAGLVDGVCRSNPGLSVQHG